MAQSVPFSLLVHAAPTSVSCTPANAGALTLNFGTYPGAYPDITLFCGSAELSVDLHAAIAGVLAKHAVPAEVEQEAA